MNNCAIFPCFTGACLALAGMFFQVLAHYLLWVGLKMPELEGSYHRHTYPSGRASWIKKRRKARLFSFSSGQKSAKLGGYQAAKLTAKAEAGSVTGAAGWGLHQSPPSPQDGIMGGLSQQHSKWVGLSCDTGSFHNLIRSLLSIKKNISEL